MFLVDGRAVLGFGHELAGAVGVGVRGRLRGEGRGGAAGEGPLEFFAEWHCRFFGGLPGGKEGGLVAER